MKSYRQSAVLAVFALLAAGVVLITPFIGMKIIPPAVLLQPEADSVMVEIFWTMRMPRVLLAFFVGASLALSGMAFQAMFRNPLATPFTLGVSSGASLGAALYVRIGLVFSVFGIGGITFFSFFGAAGSILLVYGLTRFKQSFSTATLLLAGVAVNFFFSSFILLMQYMSDFTQSFRILRWLMGDLSVSGYGSVTRLLPFCLVGIFIVLSMSHELNLLALGEDLATSRGLNSKRIKNILFFAISLTVGGAVSVCGPIGFVGMMAPHICRLVVGANHRVLAPATLLFGGAFLTFCDTLARTLIAPAEIPVGVITALLGGPFFLWLLIR